MKQIERPESNFLYACMEGLTACCAQLATVFYHPLNFIKYTENDAFILITDSILLLI